MLVGSRSARIRSARRGMAAGKRGRSAGPPEQTPEVGGILFLRGRLMGESHPMSPLPTVVIGFGKNAASDSEDLRTRLYYPYATHAQVLRSHPHFAWEAV